VGRRIAKGFRGPSGIVVTGSKTSEKIFIVDHGPRGGDELNLLIENKDYGWPYVSYGLAYDGFKEIDKNYIDTNFGSHEGFVNPIYYWSPSIAPSQIIALKENFDSFNSFARGDLILGSLKARSIFRIKVNNSSTVMSIEKVAIGARIRDISIESKKIFLSTDDGRIIVLKVDNSKIDEGQFPEEKSKKYFYEENYILKKLTNFFDKTIIFLHSKFMEFN
jgi:glucose/arabinose dehydrogenase